MDGAPLTFPLPLPVILSQSQAKDGKKEPMPVIITGMNTDLEEQQLDTTLTLTDYFKQFWDNKKKYQALDKLNLKMSQDWSKIGVGRFATGVTKGLKTISSGISGLASGLFGALMGLLVLAWLDPSGGFLASIIMMLTNFIVMFIDVIARLIPKLVPIIVKIIPILADAFVKIIEEVAKLAPIIMQAFISGIPQIFTVLKKIVPKVVNSIMDVVIGLMSQIKDKVPFLEPILTFIEKTAEGIKNLFDPNGGTVRERLSTFAKEIFSNLMTGLMEQFSNIRNLANELFGEKNIRALEALLILYGVFQIALWAISGVLSLVNFLIGMKKILLWAEAAGLIAANAGMWGMVAALWAMVAPILPIVLGVLLLIAAFVLLYVYWDEVVEFFKWAWEWLKQTFISIWEWLVEFIPIIIDAIFDGLEATWDWIVDMFYYLGDLIMVAVDALLDGFRWIGKQLIKIKDKIFNIFTAILKVFMETFDKIKNIFSGKLDIGSSITQAIKGAFNNIPGMSAIREWFDSLMTAIENSAIGKTLKKVKNLFKDKEEIISEKLIEKKFKDDKAKQVANIIKDYISYGAVDVVAEAKSQGMTEAQVNEIVTAIQNQKIEKGESLDSSKMEALLSELVKLQSKPGGQLNQYVNSNTAKK